MHPTPPTRLAPSTRTPLPMGRRRKRAARIQASVLAQCDKCGCTDDTEDRIGRLRHEDCGGTFRLYGTRS